MNDLKFTTAGDYMNDTNDRIQELEKQCWSHRVNGTLVDGQLHFDAKKFAELIVQECVDQVELFNVWPDVRPRHIVEAIKEHFGVEE